MNTRLRKILIGCISAIFILSMIFAFYFLYKEENKKRNYLEFVLPTVHYFDYYLYKPDWVTREIVREEVDKLVCVKYKYSEADLQYPTRGHANIKTNNVVLDKDLSVLFYTFCLTHELMHIKYKSLDERFCNFKAWQTLYESDNGYFRNVAMYFANLDLHGGFDYDYQFAGHVELYLRNN